MLQESTILDLQKILLEEFSCEYSKEQTAEIAESLVSFVETLLEIKNSKNTYEHRRNNITERI